MIGGSTQQRPSNNRSSLLSQSLQQQQQQQQQQQFSQPQRTQDHPNPKSHPLSIDMSKLSHHNHKHHRISPTSPINNKPTVITSSSSDSSGHINTPTSTSSTSTIPTTISTTSTNTSISNVGGGSTKPYQIPDFFGIVESDVYRCSLPTKSDHFAFLETLQLRTIIFLSQEMNERSLVSFCDRNRIQLINLGTSLIQYPSVNSTNCWNFDLGTSSSSSSSSSCSFVGRSNNFNMNNHHNNNSSSTNSTMATTSTTNNREKATTTTTTTATKQQIDHTDEYHTINVSCTSWKHCSEKLVKETLELLLDRRSHPILVMCSSGIHLTGTVIGCLRRLQCWALSSILDEYDSFAHARSRYADRQFIELFDTDLICLPSAPTSLSSSSSLTTTFGQEHNDDGEEHNDDNGVNDDENEPIVPEWFMVQRELMQYEVQYMNRNRVPVKSSQVPALTKEDSRLAFEEYWFCRDAPLISAKSTFSKHSVIEEEDD